MQLHHTQTLVFVTLIYSYLYIKFYSEHYSFNCYICFRNEIFENPAAGASPDATKVLVLITDGDPSDGDNGVIKRYDDKNIIRFVIGVNSFSFFKMFQFICPTDQVTTGGIPQRCKKFDNIALNNNCSRAQLNYCNLY